MASEPLPKAADTPMSAAAGMVVTEINTPMRVLARASVREITPTTPASTATMTENQLGVLMRLLRGRTPTAKAFGSSLAARITRLSRRGAITARAMPTFRICSDEDQVDNADRLVFDQPAQGRDDLSCVFVAGKL